MTEQSRCPSCQSVLPPDAPAGLCPACLLGAAVEPAPGEPDRATAAAIAPSIAELTPMFPQLEILGLIGQGGMGAVYRARQPHLQRLVALKILRAELAVDPAFAERFAREGRAMAGLAHPNLVTIHDIGRSGPWYWILMEYVNGSNLRQLMAGVALPEQQTLGILPQLCDALQYAHDQGVVHRDIKPENILIDQRGRVKVADFGMAKLVSREPGRPALTATRDVVGTAHYMAPEQVSASRDVDHRADIYSLGVVLYEMLTGRLPLGRFAAPSACGASDGRLDDVAMKALAQDPAQRYQQASQLQADVASAVNHGSAGNAAKFMERWLADDGITLLIAGIVVLSAGLDQLMNNVQGVSMHGALNLILGAAISYGGLQNLRGQDARWAIAGKLMCVVAFLGGGIMGNQEGTLIKVVVCGLLIYWFWFQDMVHVHPRVHRWLKTASQPGAPPKAPGCAPAGDNAGASRVPVTSALTGSELASAAPQAAAPQAKAPHTAVTKNLNPALMMLFMALLVLPVVAVVLLDDASGSLGASWWPGEIDVTSNGASVHLQLGFVLILLLTMGVFLMWPWRRARPMGTPVASFGAAAAFAVARVAVAVISAGVVLALAALATVLFCLANPEMRQLLHDHGLDLTGRVGAGHAH